MLEHIIWVKILDSVKGKPTWVPPSVVLPGVYGSMIESDKWFNKRIESWWIIRCIGNSN